MLDDDADSTKISTIIERARQGDERALEELLQWSRAFLRDEARQTLAPQVRVRVDESDLVQKSVWRHLNSSMTFAERPERSTFNGSDGFCSATFWMSSTANGMRPNGPWTAKSTGANPFVALWESTVPPVTEPFATKKLRSCGKLSNSFPKNSVNR